MSAVTIIIAAIGTMAAVTFAVPTAPASGPAPGQAPQHQQCPDGLSDKLEEAYETCMSEGEKGGGKSKRSAGLNISLGLLKEGRTEIHQLISRARRAEKEEHSDDELSPEMIGCAVEAVRKQIPEIDKIVQECQGGQGGEEGKAGSGGSAAPGAKPADPKHAAQKQADPKEEKKEGSSGGGGDHDMLAHCFVGKLKMLCPELEGLE